MGGECNHLLQTSFCAGIEEGSTLGQFRHKFLPVNVRIVKITYKDGVVAGLSYEFLQQLIVLCCGGGWSINQVNCPFFIYSRPTISNEQYWLTVTAETGLSLHKICTSGFLYTSRPPPIPCCVSTRSCRSSVIMSYPGTFNCELLIFVLHHVSVKSMISGSRSEATPHSSFTLFCTLCALVYSIFRLWESFPQCPRIPPSPPPGPPPPGSAVFCC